MYVKNLYFNFCTFSICMAICLKHLEVCKTTYYQPMKFYWSTKHFIYLLCKLMQNSLTFTLIKKSEISYIRNKIMKFLIFKFSRLLYLIHFSLLYFELLDLHLINSSPLFSRPDTWLRFFFQNQSTSNLFF